MSRKQGRRKPKIMFVVAEDWYLLSHRLQLARTCRERDWEVAVATRVLEHGAAIEREGFRVVHLRLRRRDRAPWKEILSIVELARLYRRERPDLVHQIGLKPWSEEDSASSPFACAEQN